MAHENCKTISVQVATDAAGVGAALPNRFAIWKTSGGNEREVTTHVPGATGAAAVGILAMKADPNVKSGLVQAPMIVPDGGVAPILLGENCTQGAKLRVGGNSTEVDGAAYLADATGDVIVGYALMAGSAGEIIDMHFVGFADKAP